MHQQPGHTYMQPLNCGLWPGRPADQGNGQHAAQHRDIANQQKGQWLDVGQPQARTDKAGGPQHHKQEGQQTCDGPCGVGGHG